MPPTIHSLSGGKDINLYKAEYILEDPESCASNDPHPNYFLAPDGDKNSWLLVDFGCQRHVNLFYFRNVYRDEIPDRFVSVEDGNKVGIPYLLVVGEQWL